MPKSVKPRTDLTCGVEMSADTMGYVIWCSIRSGLRPIHSVETITCTSEMSGTASSGGLVMAQMPDTVRTTVPVKTRNRLDAHQSIIRSIMKIARHHNRGRVPLLLLLDSMKRCPPALHAVE